MLHWLAGKQLPEDPDTTGYVEPPETPAPVFAVRAFKHAIFGTPQTQQVKPRRNSNTDHPRTRQHDTKAQRPGMTRPRSANDAQGLWKSIEEPLPEQSGSPTKGILMTPGTAGAKRKTVSFGDQFMDNEDKQPARFGVGDEALSGGLATDRSKNKLTEALEQARDESAKRKSKYAKHNRAKDEGDVEPTDELANPQSQSGVYWKAQYDIYRENTQREVKKLITKQKAAKSFAKEKDEECNELTEKLQQEKTKVEKLEQKMLELERQLKDLRVKGQNSSNIKDVTVPSTSTVESKATPKSQEITKRKLDRLVPRLEALKGTRLSAATALKSSGPNSPQTTQPPASEDAVIISENILPSDRDHLSAPAASQPKRTEDIWAQSFNSSSPVNTRAEGKPPLQTTNGRPTSMEANAKPLKSLSINALQQRQSERREAGQVRSSGDQPSETPAPCPGDMLPLRQHCEQIKRTSQSTSPPVVAEELQPSPERKTQAKNHASVADEIDDISIPVPASSPFHSLPPMSSPPISGMREPIPRQNTTGAIMEPQNTKENVAPSASRTRLAQENVKPSAAWSAINAPAAGKRTASIVDKKGREISNERLEAAKARLAARGKLVS